MEHPQSTSSQDPKFCQVVAVDSDFGVFHTCLVYGNLDGEGGIIWGSNTTLIMGI